MEKNKQLKLLKLLSQENYWNSFINRLSENKQNWISFQYLLRIVKSAGFEIKDFNGYVFDTNGAGKYYPSLSSQESDEKYKETRKAFLLSINEWLKNQ